MSEQSVPRPAGRSGADDYASRRVDYDDSGLLEQDLAADPLTQFERWYADAVEAGEPEPNAMVLATVGPDGAPSARNVLLKQADPRGFVFFTNYGSRKAREIGLAGPVALVFRWPIRHRQVCVRGRAERLDRNESVQYFGQRPWGSRISAWASHQSDPVRGRAALEAAWSTAATRWPDRGGPQDVPVPEHWGGFLVRPAEVEFWQGRPSRLHDRLVFVADGAAAPDRPGPIDWRVPMDRPDRWRVERRQP